MLRLTYNDDDVKFMHVGTDDVLVDVDIDCDIDVAMKLTMLISCCVYLW